MKNILKNLLIILGLTACSENAVGPDGNTGQGGSLARFAIVGDYLYTVSPDHLTTFDISSPDKTFQVSKTDMFLWGVETVFPFKNYLFLGAQTGMSILDLKDPVQPEILSTYAHIRSCDPVVTDGVHAFVTLRTGSACFTGVNQLDILDVTNLNSPSLVKSYPMNNPKGIGLRDNELFVCDEGLKVYDVSDVRNIQLLATHHISANDIIVHPDKILVIADDGLYQYATTPEGLQLLNKTSLVYE